MLMRFFNQIEKLAYLIPVYVKVPSGFQIALVPTVESCQAYL